MIISGKQAIQKALKTAKTFNLLGADSGVCIPIKKAVAKQLIEEGQNAESFQVRYYEDRQTMWVQI